ncbi:MAG: S1-C subfamily serine protease/pSer/pThr/pTyr-binding forkhead associated (FHA) protein [Planctomycetota bacterium]|jgi:S1-C subfamily serine protease/pSer/pThr/pTyr-binding forkhead associated (FHA) protein
MLEPRSDENAEASPLPKLKPLQVFGLTRPIELISGSLTVGRADTNDLVLPGDVFPSVSTHHARVEFADDGLTVEDLGSKNGTLINDAPIEGKAMLKTGDILQFGPIGPRFVVISSSPLEETMFVDPVQVGAIKKDDSLSATRVARIREAIGVPENVGGVEDLVRRRSNRQLIRSVLLVVLVAVAASFWMRNMIQKTEASQTEAQEEAREGLALLRKDFIRDHAALSSTLLSIQGEEERIRSERSAIQKEAETEKQRLSGERTALLTRLDHLEQGGSSSTDSIAKVRAELNETKKALSLLDPVNLQSERLVKVRSVRKAIVLIEAKIFLRNTDDGELLYEAPDGTPNFDNIGTPLSLDSTGSGFCVSDDGWIMTNAHVVVIDEEDENLAALKGTMIVPELQLSVVFSGESKRYPATRGPTVYSETEDLALVKIEPFEGMPFIEGFTLETPPLAQLESVYLFGFPLGNFVLQQGETVIASAFRGILSRSVGDRLQVDAGVHPGNSGGPVTDGEGNVIGVVVSVQVEPSSGSTPVYSIGYAIPISHAAKIWPPPDE